VVATGALRGAGNTRIPMLVNLVGYWVLGLPLGTLLCFRLNMGAAGMWVGLCLALVLIGSILAGVWSRLIKHTVANSAAAGALQVSK
jgi:MATE family multidrug resistance protein